MKELTGVESRTLITEHASPALLAVAFPRTLTGPMNAAWVWKTILAVLAVPSNFAPKDIYWRK